MHTKPFLFVALMSGLIAGCLWLGFWQLDRLSWKEALLASIKQAAVEPPSDLDKALSPESSLLRPYALYRVKGHVKLVDLVGIQEVAPSLHPSYPDIGYRVMAPLCSPKADTKDKNRDAKAGQGPSKQCSIIDLGWTSRNEFKVLTGGGVDIPPAGDGGVGTGKRTTTGQAIFVDAVGEYRPYVPGWWEKDWPKRQESWGWLPRVFRGAHYLSHNTLSAMSVALLSTHWSASGAWDMMPLDVRGKKSPGGYALGYVKLLQPANQESESKVPPQLWVPPYKPPTLPNNHLQYAITWFAMAFMGFLMLAMWGQRWYKSLAGMKSGEGSTI